MLYPILIALLIVLPLVFLLNKKTSHKTDDKIVEIKTKIQDIHPIVKTLNFTEAKESFTLNKKNVHLCIRDENGNYYHDNMLIYVALHEVAHTLSNEIIEDKNNHTQNFFAIFSKLLKKAENMGIYNPSIRPIRQYCGL